MTWLSALPVAVVAIAWVLLPGLAVLYPLGVRGVAAFGAAPAVSLGSLAVVAVVAGQIGLAWSPASGAGGSLVLAAAAVGLRFAVRRIRGRKVVEPEGREPVRAEPVRASRAGLLAALVGTSIAAALATVTAALGMGAADRLSQTYDAVFHYNAVAEILDTGNASSLAAGALTSPGAASAFYPAAWHGLVSLVVGSGAPWLSSVPVPVASNVAAIVVAGVVWPLSSLLLVRQVAGRNAAAMLITPIVAVGFIAFPWSLLGFGVLWPNLLGLALAPVGLAAVVTLCGLARDSALSRGQAFVIALWSLAALGLAHPSAVFSVAVLSIPPLLWWLVARLRALSASGRWTTAAALVVAVPGVTGAGLAFVLASPLLDDVRVFDWPAFQSPAQAVGEVLLNATNSRDAAWSLSVVVIAGAVAAARTTTTRWLIPAHLISGGLYMLAASLETATAAALTSPWYDDSFRLAAMVPITGVPLAVLGLVAAGTWAAQHRRSPRPDLGLAGPVRSAVAGPGRYAGVSTVAATAVLVALSSGLYLREHADSIRAAYTASGDGTVLTQQHREFLDRITTLVPPDAVVAQNPWTGSALLWALADRKVLFPHMDGDWGDDRRYLADHLDEVARDVEVCAAAERLDVDYALTGEVRFWPWDPRTHAYPGMDDIAGAAGFELVAAGAGPYRLYRITACDAVTGGTS